MKTLLRLLPALIVLLLISGCATSRHHEQAVMVIQPEKLSADLRTIKSLQPQLAALDKEIHAFRLAGNWKARGYFDATETKDIETLLFRFATYHTVLWDMLDSYGGQDQVFTSDELELKAHLVSATATLLLASHTAYFVTEFGGDPIAIRQINQSYYRSDIPFGTYDTARENVSNAKHRQAVLSDKPLFDQARANPQSPMSRLASIDTAFAELIDSLPELLERVDERLDLVAQIYPSGFASELEADKDKMGQQKSLYFVRSVVFKDVSRLKSPTAHLIEFSSAQKEQMYELLQPGDLVLTYTAGYMSSAFIPGAFKHGITYIGSPEERQSLALSVEDLPAKDVFEPEKLAGNLQKAQLNNGQQADMIEAVAEGVIFNNIGHIMDTHINRMLVLRPMLTDAERRAFLVGIYSYLGDGYDFRFDFSDATYQVCTEVIYRAIDGKGNIEFKLTERAGHPTLSADDVVNYYLDNRSTAFSFVAYAEEDPNSTTHQAIVLTGEEGAFRVESLMSSLEK